MRISLNLGPAFRPAKKRRGISRGKLKSSLYVSILLAVIWIAFSVFEYMTDKSAARQPPAGQTLENEE